MIHMKRLAVRFARLATAATLTVLLAATATAARTSGSRGLHGNVKFYVDVRFTQPAGQGTFATSGAFTDSGTFTSYSAGAAPVGKTRIWRRFAGKRGSIIVQDVFETTETGSWTILSGTGAYARLRGRGTSVGMPLATNLEDVLPPTRAFAVAQGTVFTRRR
jgi:hypothetical protein